MGIEIERKFLLAGDGWRKLVTRSQPMKQGYLAAEGGKASTDARYYNHHLALHPYSSWTQ